MENHPPIPPECADFKYEPDGKYFADQKPHWLVRIPIVRFGYEHFEFVKFEGTHAQKYASTLARCAWFDYGVSNRLCCHEEIDIEFQACLAHAQAWKLWGENV